MQVLLSYTFPGTTTLSKHTLLVERLTSSDDP